MALQRGAAFTIPTPSNKQRSVGHCVIGLACLKLADILVNFIAMFSFGMQRRIEIGIVSSSVAKNTRGQIIGRIPAPRQWHFDTCCNDFARDTGRNVQLHI